MSDGDGWTRCALGHRHWGRFGAAGLLLVAPGPPGSESPPGPSPAAGQPVPHVLLQHRAPWSHHGGTWGIPGGARAGSETAVQAALREAAEETGLAGTDVTVRGEVVDDHGGWAYTTVLAAAATLLAVHPLDGESVELRWVPVREVEQQLLHPGFAAGWPAHRATLLAA